MLVRGASSTRARVHARMVDEGDEAQAPLADAVTANEASTAGGAATEWNANHLMHVANGHTHTHVRPSAAALLTHPVRPVLCELAGGPMPHVESTEPLGAVTEPSTTGTGGGGGDGGDARSVTVDVDDDTDIDTETDIDADLSTEAYNVRLSDDYQ